jgi:cytochrome c556
MKNIFLIVAGLLLCLLSASALPSDPDKRQVLLLNTMQRHHILSEMRALLQGTQAILQGITDEDMHAIAEQARALGTEMPHKGENHLRSVLPDEFVKMGMSVHQGFDQIAAEAESSKDAKLILKLLSNTTQACVACHATYQIQVKTPPKNQKLRSEHDKH